MGLDVNILKGVEADDYHENKGSSFSSMLTPKIKHISFIHSNKMFVIAEVVEDILTVLRFLTVTLETLRLSKDFKSGYNV